MCDLLFAIGAWFCCLVVAGYFVVCVDDWFVGFGLCWFLLFWVGLVWPWCDCCVLMLRLLVICGDLCCFVVIISGCDMVDYVA